jgi:hypothetical protein
MDAGRRARVRDNEAASMSWREERVSCCGRRRADAMVMVGGRVSRKGRCGNIYCDATMHRATRCV